MKTSVLIGYSEQYRTISRKHIYIDYVFPHRGLFTKPPAISPPMRLCDGASPDREG
jgi:hypothetical protein